MSFLFLIIEEFETKCLPDNYNPQLTLNTRPKTPPVPSDHPVHTLPPPTTRFIREDLTSFIKTFKSKSFTTMANNQDERRLRWGHQLWRYFHPTLWKGPSHVLLFTL